MEKKLKSVLCQWCRLDKAYKFSAAENRSVQTEATDPDGSYEVTLVLTEEQAKDLAGDMRKTYEAGKQAGWSDWSPQALTDVFKKDETGHYLAKLKKKTYGDPGSKPRQWMPDGGAARDDFQLTSGSTIHVSLAMYAWNMGGRAGVAMRPLDIMVVNLAEASTGGGGGNPFAADAVTSNPFGLPNQTTPAGAPQAQEAPPLQRDLDDEIPF
jgi:hypothetical protein